MDFEEYKRKDAAWEKTVDKTSIDSVFLIFPDKFEKRISEGKYDKSLSEKVPGGIYEVPLYYVTKAWDYILKGDLCSNDWRVEIDEDEEINEEFGPERPLEQAISQNDEMKRIWKELLNIDIDALDIDFSQFEAHMPPNISEYESCEYFNHYPYEIAEDMLNVVNRPFGGCTFMDVSSLMEYAAYLTQERLTWNED